MRNINKIKTMVITDIIGNHIGNNITHQDRNGNNPNIFNIIANTPIPSNK